MHIKHMGMILLEMCLYPAQYKYKDKCFIKSKIFLNIFDDFPSLCASSILKQFSCNNLAVSIQEVLAI